MIHETTHTETFVIDDAITEVDTVDTLVAELWSVDDTPSGVTVDHGITCCVDPFIFRVVDTIRIEVRALEEVDTDRWRVGTVSLCLTVTVDSGTVVTVTKTT